MPERPDPVEDDPAAEPSARPWLALAGMGNSGGSDIARFKDEYLGEAVEAEVLGEAHPVDTS